MPHGLDDARADMTHGNSQNRPATKTGRSRSRSHGNGGDGGLATGGATTIVVAGAAGQRFAGAAIMGGTDIADAGRKILIRRIKGRQNPTGLKLDQQQDDQQQAGDFPPDPRSELSVAAHCRSQIRDCFHRLNH